MTDTMDTFVTALVDVEISLREARGDEMGASSAIKRLKARRKRVSRKALAWCVAHGRNKRKLDEAFQQELRRVSRRHG